VFDTVISSGLRSLSVSIPPLPTQRRIAGILGALDDKIEVNRRINRTLEAMAGALYKHWFVDFGPFQDGEFAESELGLIPKGWRVGNLGQVARNEKIVVDPQDLDPDTPYIGLGDMPKGSITLDTWGMARDSTSTKFSVKRGQILFGKLRPYFKKVGIAPVDSVCSTDILVLSPKRPMHYGMVLSQLIQQEFIDYTEAVSGGTRMPRVNWKMMAKYPMALPDITIAQRFDEIVKPWVETIIKNVAENHTLAATRGYLLPSLLSGEISVEAGEEVIVKAARER
jgi:type I restriction enzyme S subunit